MIIGKYIHKNTKSILDHLNPNIIHDFNLIYEHLLLYFLFDKQRFRHQRNGPIKILMEHGN